MDFSESDVVRFQAYGKHWTIHQSVLDRCEFLTKALEWQRRTATEGSELLVEEPRPSEQQFANAMSFLYSSLPHLPKQLNLNEYRKVGLFLGIDSLVDYCDTMKRTRAVESC